VKLELISRLKCTGRMQVSSYLSNYDSISGWNLVPGWLEDREILAVFPIRMTRGPVTSWS
jgi:hypothetical protein